MMRSAIKAWRLLSELTVRYGDSQHLRIIEAHPGGGQYNCLGLVAFGRNNNGILLLFLNIDTENITIFSTINGNAADERLVCDWSNNKEFEDLIESIANVAELNKLDDQPCIEAFTYSVISVVSQNYDIKSIFHDSSGEEGCYLKEEYRQFTPLARLFEKDYSQIDVTNYWVVQGENNLAILIGLDGRVFVSGDRNSIMNLYDDLPARIADVYDNAIKCFEVLKQYII